MEEKKCPQCKTNGRKVDKITPQSHLKPAALERWDKTIVTRFCKKPGCSVVYFQSSRVFLANDINKLVYQKSENEDRLVCYCFQHSVKEIRRDVRDSGCTEVYENISEMCKKGLDSCASKNPQGACCLGNVKSVIQTALSDEGRPDSDLNKINCGPCCDTE